MQLRRSRYEQIRHERPWETALDGQAGHLLIGWLAARAAHVANVEELPEPGADELALLEVRRPMGDGLATWRRVVIKVANQSSEDFSIASAGERLELTLPDRIVPPRHLRRCGRISRLLASRAWSMGRGGPAGDRWLAPVVAASL